MITKSEYSILSQYKDILKQWSEGCSVSMNHKMFDDVSPIIKKHCNYNGSLMCRYCELMMFRYGWELYNEYKAKVYGK